MSQLSFVNGSRHENSEPFPRGWHCAFSSHTSGRSHGPSEVSRQGVPTPWKRQPMQQRLLTPGTPGSQSSPPSTWPSPQARVVVGVLGEGAVVVLELVGG